MIGDETITASGVVMFFWDSGDDERHLLVNIDPDDHRKPAAFELVGELRDSVISELDEGVRIEVTYEIDHHEMVDPDAGTLERVRPKIVAARILSD